MAVAVDRLRRLDALFAERVLGCKVSDTGYACCCNDSPRHCDDECIGGGNDLREYTRSLDAAWEGLMKFGWEVELSRRETTDLWKCRLLFEGEHRESVSSGVFAHPAEALLLACLRAVGVSEEELNAE